MKLIILIIILTQFFCESNANPNYQWLLGIVNSTANAGIENPTQTSPNAPPSTNPTPDTTQAFTMTVTDITAGNPEFIFDTTRNVYLAISVRNVIDNAAAGSVVTLNNVDTNETNIFRAIVDQNGNVEGNFTINAVTNQVELVVSYNGQTLKTIIDIKAVYGIRRTITFALVSSPVTIVDTDGDGIQDKDDHYPNDPLRATKVLYPSSGYYTIAFEDLYPKQGDADFNDYVVRARFEEDLNAKGEVARIRTYYQHVAKGAGYNHILKLNIPNITNSNYILKNFTSTDILEKEVSVNNTNIQNIELFPSSNLTIGISNTSKNQIFQIGKKSEIEIILNSPQTKTNLGSVPYDLFIYVINTKHEIHFAGKYFDGVGNDLYIDSSGFPWAVMIPGNWKWPYEKGNIHNAYSKFENWYKSKGTLDLDWYNFPNLENVFNAE